MTRQYAEATEQADKRSKQVQPRGEFQKIGIAAVAAAARKCEMKAEPKTQDIPPCLRKDKFED